MPHDQYCPLGGPFSLLNLNEAGRHGSLPPGFLSAYIEGQREAHRRARQQLCCAVAQNEPTPRADDNPASSAENQKL